MKAWKFRGFMVMMALLLFAPVAVYAQDTSVVLPGINVGIGSSANPNDVSTSLQIIILLTILSVGPGILIMMTCFTRIIVVLSFTRNALSIQQMPPNQVLIGLALFLTFFIMAPTFQAVNANALQPYFAGRLTQAEALQQAELPFKHFMAKQTRQSDLELFLSYRHQPMPKSVDEIPLTDLVPAYAISELKTAFQIGFMIYVPFLVIDFIVSSTLMSMGMLMLPPVIISLPFKILLFVLSDGWYLIVKSLLMGYQ
jgi:flagellar biosynthetic protein FliP